MQHKTMTPTQKDAIRTLACKYRINLHGSGMAIDPMTQLQLEYGHATLEELHIEYLNILCSNKLIKDALKPTYNNPRLELAKMLLILLKAHRGRVGVSLSAQIDGPIRKATLKQGRYVPLLLHQLNDFVVNDSGRIYAREFRWSKKAKTEYMDNEVWELYTENELNTIIEYETKCQRSALKEAKNALRTSLVDIRRYFQLEGVFSTGTTEPTTSEYAFLVHTLVVLGILDDSDIDRQLEKGNHERELIRDYFRANK